MVLLHDPWLREECGEALNPVSELDELPPDRLVPDDTNGAVQRTFSPIDAGLTDDPAPIRGCLFALPISLALWGLLLLLAV
jgi:hypothetical protein